MPRSWTKSDLFDATLQALRNLSGSGNNQEIHDQVVVILELTDEEILEPFGAGRGNQTEIKYRLAWARTWLKRYGLIENSSRGVWSLTRQGKATPRVDPNELDQTVKEMVKREKETIAHEHESDAVDSNGTIPEEYAEIVDDRWRSELHSLLTGMEPSVFERLCARLLRESGFDHVDVTGRSGDGGIDGVGVVRISGFLSFRILFQCKRWKNSVGPGTVRDFRGAMTGRTDRGLIVTTGNFTPDAKREATRDGAPEIDLVDGEQLIDKLKELSLGVKTEEVVVEKVTVDPDFFANI